MTRPTHSDIASALARTERAQADAADPLTSAWVNANAGTGKTHVLTLRVLRLLLNGTAPERILCLTYTKAAAAEMSKRVFDQLGSWVTAADEALSKTLHGILGRPATHDDIARARTLFARAIETPGGFKVQTIHAFCERLLQRFPLEAGVPPGFKILDDEKGRELTSRAIEGALTEATAHRSGPLGQALTRAIRYASDANFDELLTKAIRERAWLMAASRIDLGQSRDDFAGAGHMLRATFNVRPGVMADDIERERASVLSDAELRDLAAHLATGGATDIKHSTMLAEAIRQRDSGQRASAIAEYLLTDNGDGRRKSLMTKALAEGRGDLLITAERAQGRCYDLTAELKALAVVEASTALYRLAGAVLQRYTDAKMASGSLDFDDLIQRAQSLLSTSDQAEWVLFKLDGGLDHILVDEAQDTSPEQWAIVEALGREFFSGASARDVVRTVFAVGDEKQSIYSFQGAAPEKFAAMGQRFAEMTARAEKPWRRVPLNLSFRTVQPLLDAVDNVFADTTRTPGVTSETGPIVHIAKRFGQAGSIEIWPTEAPGDANAADPWQPLSDTAERAPANRLAERIAEIIAAWLANGEMLASQGRAIRAGDILILVRKRHPFAVPMVAALKARDIPVAGSDRITLIDQIAVQDLLSLGDFLTLPEDDLALANVLKGPLFNYDDNDLLHIATGRKGTMWKALLAHADQAAKFKPAADTLRRWRAKADFTPPFEFFSTLLDRDGARTKLLHRLGPEAADAIDEFLDLALTYDDGNPPSLTGFLASLRSAKREVKRDMDLQRDEVRVMTVHGAKGLEAPIVFLPDTCTTATGDGAGTRLLDIQNTTVPVGVPDPVIWSIKGASRLGPVRDAISAQEASDRRERNRLLYVAMTRARDRMIIAGFENKKGRAPGCWYDLITDSLTPHTPQVDLGGGILGWRIEAPQTEAPEQDKSARVTAAASQTLPAFATRRATAEPQLSVPLAPSRLEPYAPDAEGEPIGQATPDPAVSHDRPSPIAMAGNNRFLRGTITHALLEHLPSIASNARAKAAAAFVDRRGGGLSSKIRASIVRETLAVLDAPEFAALFGADSRAEIAISAIIPRPRGAGPALKLSGQIDRLAVTANEVFIVDYKTNRPPPADVASVAPAYLYQLAAYALALQEIYPAKTVKAALLWTDGPRLMSIPVALLSDYTQRLWDLEIADLHPQQ